MEIASCCAETVLFFLLLDSARYALMFSKSFTRLRTYLGFVLDQLEGEVDFFAVNDPFYRLEFN